MIDGDAGAKADRRAVTEIGNDMTEKTELTGYDLSLLKRALAIAVAAIERAPPQFKSVSTQYDMNELLGRLVESDDELILYVDQAREIVGGGAD
jgi:hypothetical protein